MIANEFTGVGLGTVYYKGTTQYGYESITAGEFTNASDYTENTRKMPEIQKILEIQGIQEIHRILEIQKMKMVFIISSPQRYEQA